MQVTPERLNRNFECGVWSYPTAPSIFLTWETNSRTRHCAGIRRRARTYVRTSNERRATDGRQWTTRISNGPADTRFRGKKKKPIVFGAREIPLTGHTGRPKNHVFSFSPLRHSHAPTHTLSLSRSGRSLSPSLTVFLLMILVRLTEYTLFLFQPGVRLRTAHVFWNSRFSHKRTLFFHFSRSFFPVYFFVPRRQQIQVIIDRSRYSFSPYRSDGRKRVISSCRKWPSGGGTR